MTTRIGKDGTCQCAWKISVWRRFGKAMKPVDNADVAPGGAEFVHGEKVLRNSNLLHICTTSQNPRINETQTASRGIVHKAFQSFGTRFVL